MGETGLRPQGGLVQVVERSQSAGKQLPIDDAFCKPFGATETQPGRQLAEPLPDQALIVRTKNGEAIAHHNPVHAGTVYKSPLAARIANHQRIVALPADGISGGIHGADHVQIQKAVIQRRDERIRHGMGEASEIAVGAWRIHDDKIVRSLDRADGLREACKFDALVFVQFQRRAPGHAEVYGQL